jgi:ubiquinone/menaquinone biosynthesis C-methylase UbiE
MPPPDPEPAAGLRAASDESIESWERVASGWERRRALLWEGSRGLSVRLVDLLDPQPGDTVLELAAGPGDTGFLATERIGAAGRLISSDIAPAMVAAAERRASELELSNVDFLTQDAQALELADASVDGVLCRWGYMLVPDPSVALSETARVLRPDGRLAFAVWASADENPWASAVGRVLVARGVTGRPEPDAPGPFRLSDAERVRSLVQGAGLELLTQEDAPLTWRYRSFDEYWETTLDLSGALSSAIAALDAADASAIREDVRQAVGPYVADDGLVFPALSRVTLARRV